MQTKYFFLNIWKYFMTRRIIRLATFQKRIHMPLEAHSQEKVLKLFVRLFQTFSTQPLCTTPPLSPSHRKGQFVLHEASHLSQNFPLNINYEIRVLLSFSNHLSLKVEYLKKKFRICSNCVFLDNSKQHL